MFKILQKKYYRFLRIWHKIFFVGTDYDLKRLPINSIVFIHIGKCGGASLDKIMERVGAIQGLRIAKTHLRKPYYRKDLKYIIVIRNPIDRVISAFNFAYTKIINEKKDRSFYAVFKRMKIRNRYKIFIAYRQIKKKDKIFQNYRSINNIAESLYDQDGRINVLAHKDIVRLEHIKKGISFYLNDFLDKCRPDQIKGVIAYENYIEDIGRVLNYKDKVPHEFNNSSIIPKHMTELSELGDKNLMRFLSKDYEALIRLYCLGKIEYNLFTKILKGKNRVRL